MPSDGFQSLSGSECGTAVVRCGSRTTNIKHSLAAFLMWSCATPVAPQEQEAGDH